MNTGYVAFCPGGGVSRLLRAFSVLFLVLALLAGPAFALEVPPLTGRVNDLAGVLAPETRTELENELAALERENGAQIALLVIPTLAGENLEQYSLKVAETWALGQKGRDNGALLLLAMQEREVRIEVGHGLEGSLTDLVSGRIIRGEMVPAFKKGDYNAGVAAGLSAMIKTVQAGEYEPGEEAKKILEAERQDEDLNDLMLFLAVGCSCLGAALRQRIWLAGLVGAALGGVLGWVFALPNVAGAVFVGALIGLGAAWITRRFAGLSDISGGGHFGGGWSSGGGGGGGFSGGGGGFGGGGASGRW